VSAAGHRVTVLAVNTPKHHQPPTALDHLGPNVRMITVDVDTRLSPWKALRNLVSGKSKLGIGPNPLPYNVERFISRKFARRLAELLRSEKFDIMHFDGTFVALYARWLVGEGAMGRLPQRQDLPPKVLRAHNVEHIIWQRLAASERNPLKKWYLEILATRLRDFERWMLYGFDAIAAITAEDVGRLRSLQGHIEGQVEVIPAPANTSRFRPDPTRRPQPRSLFMLGSLNWLPNLEGVEWFLREVWPQAHRELPELTLHIAGTAPPAHLTSRPAGQDNVFIHGFVESAPDFMQAYDLMLVPLLSGGGMRVKIVEGMALGKAILSTTIGAEGIDAQDGAELLLRDGPAAWLDALHDYYHGRLPLAAIGAAAAEVAQARYSTEAVAQGFVALYEQAIAARQPAPVAP
jgi:glycosyltransferase involved in cell wall biosynthesis